MCQSSEGGTGLRALCRGWGRWWRSRRAAPLHLEMRADLESFVALAKAAEELRTEARVDALIDFAVYVSDKYDLDPEVETEVAHVARIRD